MVRAFFFVDMKNFHLLGCSSVIKSYLGGYFSQTHSNRCPPLVAASFGGGGGGDATSTSNADDGIIIINNRLEQLWY